MTADGVLTPSVLETFLLEWWPLPEDSFAAAYRYQEFLYCMKELTKVFEKRHKELIDAIRFEGLESDEFAVEVPMDNVVNTDLLKDELPTVYDNLVFIKSSAAERFIGRTSLYLLSLEAAGQDRVVPEEEVNLGDLRKALTAVEAARYVMQIPHEKLTRVVRIAE